MALGKLCEAPECGKSAPKRGRLCPMHQARLRRGDSFDLRQETLAFDTLLGSLRFGEWTVLSEGIPYDRPCVHSGRHRSGRQRTALCRCSCGNERTIPVQSLKSGASTSCGCIRNAATARRNETHGMSGTPEYSIWCKMRDRCANGFNLDYPHYGGRGIRVCARWNSSFEAFFADMGSRPSPKHSIDRIDVNGNYEPGNVRWATPHTQAQNKTTTHYVELDGERLALREACRRLGRDSDYRLIHQRMRKYGKSFAEAVQP
jgi:hypothetical protein